MVSHKVNPSILNPHFWIIKLRIHTYMLVRQEVAYKNNSNNKNTQQQQQQQQEQQQQQQQQEQEQTTTAVVVAVEHAHT